MIQYLKIRNYALIENLEIGFQSGYITITGETGAGKSILMGALSLILGQRADTSVLLNKEKKCIVEGQFFIDGHHQDFFGKYDLDFDPETLLRREILPGGKSRAFINDTPVNLNILKTLGDQLVDIHSQHQNLQLKDHSYQLQVLDYVSENNGLLEEYAGIYDFYLQKKAQYKALEAESQLLKNELDFFQFQFNELDEANLQEDELANLESEMNELEHAEDIKGAFIAAADGISGDERILAGLNEAIQQLRKSARIHKASADFADRLESAYIELKDAANELISFADRIEYDPGKLQQNRDRLDLIYSLLQKHRLKELSELIARREELNEKITRITFSDEHLEKIGKEIRDSELELKKRGQVLHDKRVKTGKYVETQISSQLTQLGIPNASFRVQVDSKEEPDKSGFSDVRFLFSANKQSPPEEISRVASGGEVSRLMLTIKSLLSDYKGLPTLIFDEIDAGVSGEIAEKMGQIMRKMSTGRQVIAITHLPQVASLGEEHFLVYKEDELQSTVTHIRKLNQQERITEIAKLLSGEKLTDAAISNARELLKI